MTKIPTRNKDNNTTTAKIRNGKRQRTKQGMARLGEARQRQRKGQARQDKGWARKSKARQGKQEKLGKAR